MTPITKSIRMAALALIALGAALLGLPGPVASGQDDGLSQPEQSAAPVRIAPLTGPIGPASTAFIVRTIEDAQGEASAIIIEMDTPGGLVDSMRDINQAILGSEIPVIVHVSPSGARATSAGAYILYAAHIAAMAPGTTVGAATPVEFGGAPAGPPDRGSQPESPAEDEEAAPEADAPSSSQALRNKAVNDSVAAIRSLAELRGRNADWAERAVREGVSLTADAAVAENVADFIAVDTAAVLARADGMSVMGPDGEMMEVRVGGAATERVEPTLPDRILATLTDPNIAFLLINIGFIGLLASFYNGLEPVTLLAGLVCLILGFYGLNTLPVNYAGAALVFLGFALLIAELFVSSSGLLALAGLGLFAVGSLMLVDTEVDALRIDWRLIAGASLLLGGGAVAAGAYGLAAQARRVTTGAESLKGMSGEVIDWNGSEGHVHVDGERWNAVSKDALAAGDPIKVVRLDGLVLTVKKAG